MTERIRVTTILILALTLPLAARQAKTPPAQPARIEGVVLDSANNRPVAGVAVTALQINKDQEAVTDAQGRFAFGVVHGTVRLVTRKEGFVSNREGTFVTVTPGQQLRNATLRISAVATVSGAVYDMRRKPVQYAHALLMKLTYDENGVRALRAAGNGRGGMTNDHGEFRIDNAEPGDYLLRVDPPLLAEREPGEPFVQVFYPGPPVETKALAVILKSGSDTHLDDLTLPSTRGGTIRIHLTNQTGIAIDNTMAKYVRWSSRGSSPNTTLIPLLIMGGQDRAEIPVAPGAYDVTAGWTRNTSAMPMPFGLGHKVVDVGRSNVEVEIPVTKGVHVSGRVVQEQAKGDPKPVDGMRCELSNDVWMTANAVSAQGGSVSFDSLQPATYRVNCTLLPPDTYLAGIKQDARDVLHDGLEVTANSESMFVVTINGNGGTLEGFVTGANGQKTSYAVAALIPDAPLHDAKHLYRSINTDQLGGFTFRAVAPGDYHLYAWPTLEPFAPWNDEFMRQYESAGTAVKVTAGGKISATTKLLN